MIQTIHIAETRRGLLLGFVIALATAGISWQAGGVGLGFALAALVGLAQTCSA